MLVILYDDMKLAFNHLASQFVTTHASDDFYVQSRLKLSELERQLDGCMALTGSRGGAPNMQDGVDSARPVLATSGDRQSSVRTSRLSRDKRKTSQKKIFRGFILGAVTPPKMTGDTVPNPLPENIHHPRRWSSSTVSYYDEQLTVLPKP